MSTNIYSQSAYVNPFDLPGDGVRDEESLRKLKHEINQLEIPYNNARNRPGTRLPKIPMEVLKTSAVIPMKLVPIRLDLEVEGVKLKDTFTWNLNETLISPEQFAFILLEDLDTQYKQQFIPLVAQQIRQQCATYGEAAEEDIIYHPKTGNEDEDEVSPENLGDDDAFGDLRIVVKLDFNVGTRKLSDKFEWPLFSKYQPTPEDFARQLCSDLGLGGVYAATIAHSIREQVCQARINFDEAEIPVDFLNRPFRSDDAADNEEGNHWEPEVRELNNEEIEVLNKEQDRTSRRMRRSQKLTRLPSAPIHTMPTFQQSLANSEASFNNWAASYEREQQRSQIPYQKYVPKHGEKHHISTIVNRRGTEDDESTPAKKKRKNGVPLPIDTELIKKQIQMMVQQNMPDGGAPPNSAPSSNGSVLSLGSSNDSIEVVAPKIHRGFGASAKVFNQDGAMDVGEYRKNWKCSWCLLSGKFTPTLRKGPLGSKTLCNACGIWYIKHGSMPQDRYREHNDTC